MYSNFQLLGKEEMVQHANKSQGEHGKDGKKH